MAFITTLMFFVYENLAMDAVVAIIPLTLLLINRQVRTALIYGGLFALALVAKLTQGMYVLPDILNMIFYFSYPKFISLAANLYIIFNKIANRNHILHKNKYHIQQYDYQ